MRLPAQVQTILRQLEDNGYQAYAVGGCVRDTLLGKAPSDWDICTSAQPQQIHACFAGCRLLDTGLAHGTVTLVLDHVPYEITTFRVDGRYADHRRPDQVQFVTDLAQDLARRDFTVNAMACGLDGQVIDLYGGQAHLQEKLICCVGDPARRFEEDALRILRALRFASVLGFAIEPGTLAAARQKQQLLDTVAAERVFIELEKTLCGQGAGPVLRACGDILAQIVPEVGPCIGFDQKNPCHDRDVWFHTVDALAAAPQERILRWALLLHDLSKPQCFVLDGEGIGHCPRHPEVSEQMAHQILRRLKADKKLEKAVCQLILWHDTPLPPDRSGALRWLNRLGPEQVRRLVTMKGCDIQAHAMVPVMERRKREVDAFARQTEAAIACADCTCIEELRVDGRDLMALGIPAGPEIGRLLHLLLEQVLEQRLPNDRTRLLDCAAHWHAQQA